MRPRRLVVTFACVGCSALPQHASGQSVVAGDLVGRTLDANGSPLAGVIITIRSREAGLTLETSTSRAGDFNFEFLATGLYEIRAEAFGYRPVVARWARVGIATSDRITLRLTAEPPPVTQVDTVSIGADQVAVVTVAGNRLGPREISGLPHLTDDLADLARLSSSMDRQYGSEGLPGTHTVTFVDGSPLFRAAHPRIRSDGSGPLSFPKSSLNSLDLLPAARDIEWTGAAGAYLVGTSTSGTTDGALELEGSWSGDAIWNSDELSFDPPSLTSFWGRAGVGANIRPDTGRVFLQAEGLQLQVPRPPRLTAAAVDGLPPGASTGQLLGPTVEELRRISGYARLDWAFGPSDRMTLRAAGARSERTLSGPEPFSLGHGAAPSEETTEFSLSTSFISRISDDFALELRAGLSGSDRSFLDPDPAEGPSTSLIDPTASFGPLPGGAGTVSRVDFFASPVVHMSAGDGTLKGGGWIRSTWHDLDYVFGSSDEFVFADAARVGSGGGLYTKLAGPGTSSFSTDELGGFLQYSIESAEGIRVTLGARFDSETLPADQIELNERWLEVSGLRNDSLPRRLDQFGARVALEWDLVENGATRFSAVGSLQHGDIDVGLLHEAFTLDGDIEATRTASDVLDWPDAPSTADGTPVLALLNADLEAPQTWRVSAGLRQRVTAEWSLSVAATFRRTDFIPRRRDLNLTTAVTAEDQHGRGVFGELLQHGSLIGAEPSSNRRFGEFDAVWALDADGWSEYRGVTIAIEHRSELGSLFGSYTRSETEDNWIGAAGGHWESELPPGLSEVAWDEGISDFDVPHRIAAGAIVNLGTTNGGAISAVYRFSSGLPFTPGYRRGVDINGDGARFNDVAFVPDELDGLESTWACLRSQRGGFASRNSCRGPDRHSLDMRIRLGLARFGTRTISVVVDALNLVEEKGGVLDTGLALVDPSENLMSDGAGTVTIPTLVNPDFGSVLIPASVGRILRIGVRIGGLTP